MFVSGCLGEWFFGQVSEVWINKVLTDWLTWLTDWLTWLTDWLSDMADWLHGWHGWLTDWLTHSVTHSYWMPKFLIFICRKTVNTYLFTICFVAALHPLPHYPLPYQLPITGSEPLFAAPSFAPFLASSLSWRRPFMLISKHWPLSDRCDSLTELANVLQRRVVRAVLFVGHFLS